MQTSRGNLPARTTLLLIRPQIMPGITRLPAKRRSRWLSTMDTELWISWKSATLFRSDSTCVIPATPTLLPFNYFLQDRQTPRAVSLDVRADGHRQILSITNYSAEHSLYKPRRRSTGSLARSDTMSSSQEAFEAVTEEITPTLTVNIAFAGIGLSLMNRKLVEVVYLSVNTLAFEYTSSDVAQAVTLTCGTVQIDNQLHDALFPVVLQPSPVSKGSSGVAALPTVQASFIWLNDEG